MPQTNIRNFGIIAHVDHGKSTLSDRLLEITNTVSKEKMKEQFLDQNPISRERGITIKLAPVRMKYRYQSNVIANDSEAISDPGQARMTGEVATSPASPRDDNRREYILNLIDTPGHVDFSYEVSRTLAACEGAILLVDATQGIQAQTVAHFQAAKKAGLVMTPVVNKIDLDNTQVKLVTKELVNVFGFKEDEVIYISAKTGQNVGQLINVIIKKLPPPTGRVNSPLRALIFNAVYDEYRGVIAYVKVVDGEVRICDKIQLFQSKVITEVTEVGYFSPFLKSTDKLSAGEIGYIITGIKNIRECRVGDTVISSKFKVQSFGFAQDKSSKLATDESGTTIESLPGYSVPKPMVFLEVYPKNTDDLVSLKESLTKLSLNDAALAYTESYSAYLGSGYRIGFLGLLHAEIVKERLKQEFNLDLLFTMPNVSYQKNPDGSTLEPYMRLTIYTPSSYVGPVMSICQRKKGGLLDLIYHDTYAVLSYDMPYSMLIRGLSAQLKSVSAGFASIDYELAGYKEADLVSLEILINGTAIDVLSELVYREEALSMAREKAEKLKESLSRQQFRQIIQGVINGNIVAREEIPPFRKDVLAKMSGGDRTRKDKLLKKQKKGKSRLLSTSKVVLPQEALLSVIEKS